MRVHSCPVRYYYERNDPIVESDRYAICKQLSYHLGNPLDPDVIWDEVLAVRPGIDADMRSFLDTCITACNKNTWRSAAHNDVNVHSDKHGIVGMVDRLATDGNYSIIRASGAMPFGTYSSDRLRISCIALCLEEMTGNEVTGGTCGIYSRRSVAIPYSPAPGPEAGDCHPAQDPFHPSGGPSPAPVQCTLQPLPVPGEMRKQWGTPAQRPPVRGKQCTLTYIKSE